MIFWESLIVFFLPCIIYSNAGDLNAEIAYGIPGVCECKSKEECKLAISGETVIDPRYGNDDVCLKYNKVCCGNSLSQKQATNRLNAPLPESKIPKKCGYRNENLLSNRVTTNTDAQFGEFPWMVAVLRKKPGDALSTYQCGGSLIHPKVVLTSAYCVTGKNGPEGFKLLVRAGEWDSETSKEAIPYQEKDVGTLVVHPHYFANALYNNMALLFLESEFTLTDNVHYVCLPKKEKDIGATGLCFSSGWGKNKFSTDGLYQNVLKKVELPIVLHDQCDKILKSTRLGPRFTLHRTFLCAGGEAGKDTCTGDGGSPLVCQIPSQPGRFEEVGIVSWGLGCANAIPAVYTNVQELREWIDEQMIFNEVESVHNY